MFLSILTPPQQRVFLGAARAVVEQDGQVAEVEQALLDGLRSECGIDELPTTSDDVASVRDAASTVLDNDTARRAFVLELAGVVFIDGDAHAAEVAAVTEIAGGLGIAADQLDAMFAFAARAQALVVEGQRLIATQSAAP